MTRSMRPSPSDLKRYRQNYLNEKDGAALYRALAKEEKNERRATVLHRLAEAEERHAERWAGLLRIAEEAVPEHRPGMEVRLLRWLARHLGTKRVLPIVSGLEARDQEHYVGQPEARGLPAEERAHGRAVRGMEAPAGAEGILLRETWHHRGQSGSLRAAVFGVNDGLVSNFSLVMGVAGANASPGFILLSGVAGMLAGAFSMGSGEYVSMKAQREMLERQIALEKEELETSPQEEREELSLIYQAKGVPEEEAERLASQIFQDPKAALDTLVREELGLDPAELGSPWGAAVSSFVAFTLGAIVPVLPFAARLDEGAVATSAVLSGAGLFLVGAVLSLFTTRSWWASGARMAWIGLLAAAATFGVGRLLGVSLAG